MVASHGGEHFCQKSEMYNAPLLCVTVVSPPSSGTTTIDRVNIVVGLYHYINGNCAMENIYCKNGVKNL